MKERSREMGLSPPTAEEIFRERKYNHTCVVALQIGALSMNGSRQASNLVMLQRNWGKHLLEAIQKELRRRGKVLASKKSSQMAAEGFLALAQNENKTAIIEHNCKTDFVARYISILGKCD
ncbi:hypothetical protein ACFXTH_037518 [Malus domestica]